MAQDLLICSVEVLWIRVEIKAGFSLLRRWLPELTRLVLAVWMGGQSFAESAGAPTQNSFVYQGRLTDDAKTPADGTLYDFVFSLYAAEANGAVVGIPVTNNAVPVYGGVFVVNLDFGYGVFNGTPRWLQTTVRKKPASTFQVLSPRQPLSATPQALYALTVADGSVTAGKVTGLLNAANIPGLDTSKIVSGNLEDARLTPNVALLNRTNVFSSTNTFNGVVKATNANNQFTGTFTGNGAALTALNATQMTTGELDPSRVPNLDAGKITTGILGVTRVPDLDSAKITSGTLALARIPNLDATRIPNLDAAKITTGNLGDARLTPNVALLNRTNVFTSTNTFNGVVQATNASNQFTGTFTGNGAALTALNASQVTTGVLDPSRVPTLDAAKIASGILGVSRIPDLDAAKITSGTLALARIPNLDATRIPNLDAAKISTGELDPARVPTLDAAKIASGILGVTRIPDLDAAKIASGTLALARIPNLDATRIPNLDAAKITTGELEDARLSPNVALLNRTNVFTSTNTFKGAVTATNANNQFTGTFTGNGSAVTALNADQVTTGVLDPTRVPTLDAGKITTGVLGVTRIPDLDAAKITSGTLVLARIPNLDATRIPNLDAAKISTGVLDPARVPNLDANKITTGTLAADRIPSLDATKIGAGTLADDRLGSGIARTSELAALQATVVALQATVAALAGGSAGGTVISPNPGDPALLGAGLRLTVTVAAPGWVDDSAAATAPLPRSGHTAVWTGQEMIVWGGNYLKGKYLSDGASYRPELSQWIPVALYHAPEARMNHSAVWTGTEMLVWGGYNGTDYLAGGGRFTVGNNLWVSMSPSILSARERHGAVWTGSRWVIWGGSNAGGRLADGALYDPLTDSWTLLPGTGAPAPRAGASMVWAGDRLLVWGGDGASGLPLNTGAQLLFVNGLPTAWSPINASGAPSARSGHTAVWTGQRLLVWGGTSSASTSVGDGAAYDPASNSWQPLATANAPSARSLHNAVWTGSEMVVYGGQTASGLTATGAAYDPATDQWRVLGNPGSPQARTKATAIWSGTEVIFFGGRGNTSALAALQRLNPQPAWYFFRKP